MVINGKKISVQFAEGERKSKKNKQDFLAFRKILATFNINLAPGAMKSRKEAGQLRQQIEKIKHLQEVKRQKNEMARKIREGIPLTPNDQVCS